MVFKLTSVGLEASGVITSSSANIDANISASNVDTSTSGSSSNTPTTVSLFQTNTSGYTLISTYYYNWIFTTIYGEMKFVSHYNGQGLNPTTFHEVFDNDYATSHAYISNNSYFQVTLNSQMLIDRIEFSTSGNSSMYQLILSSTDASTGVISNTSHTYTPQSSVTHSIQQTIKFMKLTFTNANTQSVHYFKIFGQGAGPPNEITIDSKRFLSTISFSASNPLPTYTAIPYKLKVNNSLVHTNDQIFVIVQSTDANICANAFYIKEGFFKINAFTYDTSTPYTGDLILNVYVPT